MTYYRDVVGFTGEFLFTENIEEARLMVIGGKGFMPIEGGEKPVQFSTTLDRLRSAEMISRSSVTIVLFGKRIIPVIMRKNLQIC